MKKEGERVPLPLKLATVLDRLLLLPTYLGRQAGYLPRYFVTALPSERCHMCRLHQPRGIFDDFGPAWSWAYGERGGARARRIGNIAKRSR